MKMNYKIMKKPEITNEEILRHMDFDGLLAKHHVATKESISQKLKWGIAVSVLSIATVLYFAIGPDKQMIDPIISSKTRVDDNTTKPVQEQSPLAQSQNSQQVQLEESKLITTEPVNKNTMKAESIDPNEEAIKEDVYLEAEPLLGYPHLYNYLNTNLQYPHEAVKDSIQGVESVSFIINKEGQPTKIEILNTLGAPFDKEVLRLLEKMPAWKPATLNGRPVLSKVSVPFTFKVKTASK
jgi:TonB family protein